MSPGRAVERKTKWQRAHVSILGRPPEHTWPKNSLDKVAVLQVCGLGARHGAIRRIRVEDAQVYGGLAAYILRPPLPVTVAAISGLSFCFCFSFSI